MQLNLVKANPKSIWANYIMVECREFFFTHLGDHWPSFHAQELACTNDCLASFKYTHEFVTNYDFDELIIPRKFVPTQDLSYVDRGLIKCSKDAATLNHEEYNLYRYVRKLIEKASNTTKKVASLHFEHMLLFDRMPDEFISDLLNPKRLNQSRTIKFSYNNMYINFDVNAKTDAPMISWMSNLTGLIKCFNDSIKNFNIDERWNRVHGIWMDVRKGKSVFNTDFTEYVTQHLALQIVDREAKSIDVPLADGFVSHFREPIDIQFFLGQTYSFYRHYRLDMEYINFINSFFH